MNTKECLEYYKKDDREKGSLTAYPSDLVGAYKDHVEELEKENEELKSILKLWVKNNDIPKEYNDIVNKYFWELIK